MVEGKLKFPTHVDIAEKAEVSVDTVDSISLGRRPDTDSKVAAAEIELGYVKPFFGQTTKKLNLTVVCGNYFPYLEPITRISQLPIVIPCNDQDDPLYLIRRYRASSILVFDRELGDLEEWARIDRTIILIDCPEQFIFNSINGFNYEETGKLVELMMRYYRHLPARIIKK